MNSGLLTMILGTEQRWQGPCTVILDAEAAVQSFGVDSIVGGGAKAYAPRLVSGRCAADAICLLADGSALLMIQQQKVRSATGEDTLRQTLTVADTAHIVAIEFPDTSALAALNIKPPVVRPTGSHPGTQMRPMV